MIDRQTLMAYLHELLQVERFNDYCPNGLQVEGRSAIARLACGVTASLALIEQARDWGADAVLVHHGYFWRGEDARVVGQKRKRLALLLGADINLFAYHLPLDAHESLGNNAQLARRLGLAIDARVGERELVCVGRPEPATTLGAMAERVQVVLDRAPTVVGALDRPVARVAWCTGGAQGYIEAAHAAGADVYLSGEISEPTAHFAREMGIAYLACGHHATERYGVQALAAHLAERFGLEQRYFEIDNPA